MSDSKRPSAGAVVWITGLPNSGKTTVSQLVSMKLRDRGIMAIHLDGDDLRAILSHRWGYSQADRIELAATYSRLAAHLAQQGALVVVSVVAMFDSVYERNRETIPNYLEIFLDVPYEERLLRDKNSAKHVYSSQGYTESIYDHPNRADLRIGNYGNRSPEQVAGEIIDFALARV